MRRSFLGVYRVWGAPIFAHGLATCAELFVLLEEMTTDVDLGIPADMCKLVVKTDGCCCLHVRQCGTVCDWLCVWTDGVGRLPPSTLVWCSNDP